MEIDDFDVEVLDLDCSVVLAVRGDIDMVSLPRLRSVLEKFEADAHVIVDCAGLLFIDSSGLDLLDDEARCRNLAGGSLRLRNCEYPVRQVVELTGLIDLFEFDNGDGTPDLGSLSIAARSREA